MTFRTQLDTLSVRYTYTWNVFTLQSIRICPTCDDGLLCEKERKELKGVGLLKKNKKYN